MQQDAVDIEAGARLLQWLVEDGEGDKPNLHLTKKQRKRAKLRQARAELDAAAEKSRQDVRRSGCQPDADTGNAASTSASSQPQGDVACRWEAHARLNAVTAAAPRAFSVKFCKHHSQDLGKRKKAPYAPGLRFVERQTTLPFPITFMTCDFTARGEAHKPHAGFRLEEAYAR